MFFQGGGDGRGYRNMYKIPHGPWAYLELNSLIYYPLVSYGRALFYGMIAGRCHAVTVKYNNR
jgi:hypothetical protein